MKLELVTGESTFESGKNAIGCIDKNDINTNYFIVVPDRFTLKAEDLVFDILKISATFNINVVGLTSFATSILNNAGIKIEPSSVIDGVLYIKKIIEEKNNELVFYKKSSPSFCHEILKNIFQIKSSGIKPEELQYTGKNEFLKNKIHDLQMIYSGYEDANFGKVDATDLLNLCSDNIGAGNYLDNAVVLFVGFDSFTETNFTLLKSILNKSKKVVIALPAKCSEGNAYIYDNDIIEKVRKIAKENEIELSVISTKTSLNENQKAIAQKLFSKNIDGVKKEFLQVYSATSKSDEIYNIANKIKYDIYNGGRYKDYLLACANLSEYESLIEEIFTEYEIPYYIDSSKNISNSILVNFIKKVFYLKQKDFLNQDLLYILTSKLYNADKDKITFVNEKGINGRRGFIKYIDSMKDIYSFVEKLDTASTFIDYTKIVREIIDNVRVKFDEYLGELETQGLLKEKNLEEQVPDKLEVLLSGIENRNENISLRDFLALLDVYTDTTEVSALPAFCDAVFIGDITNTYFTTNKNFVVLGANCGAIPSLVADTGLISDTDLLKLNLNKKIEPSIKMINRRNRFKLFNNLLLAQDKIIISYASVDEDGNAQDKAVFVDMLLNIFGQNVYETTDFNEFNDDNDFDKFIYTIGGSKERAKYKFIEYLKDKNIPGKFLKSLQECVKCDFENYDLHREKLGLMDLDGIYFSKGTFSVSEIERYYDCPFKHFVDYGLKLKKKETATIEKNEYGNIYHELLEKFVKQYAEKLKQLSSEDITNFVDCNLKNIINIDKFEFMDNKDIVLKNLRKDSIKILKKVVKLGQCSVFIPIAEEKAVYKDYNINGKILTLKGKIDRIDAYNDKFIILDYKTGTIKNINQALYYGNKIQLFMYSNALRKDGKTPAGVYYFNAKENYESDDKYILIGETLGKDTLKLIDKNATDKKSEILNIKDVLNEENDELARFEKYAINMSEQGIKQITAGEIKAMPCEKSCEFCDYKGICLFEKYNSSRKQSKKSKEDILREVKDEQ